MTDREREQRLDELIDALNAGRPAPRAGDDPELAALHDTVRQLQRLAGGAGASASTRPVPATEPGPDFPSRLAANLERELRRDPTIGTTRQEQPRMATLPGASSNGTLRPPADAHDEPLSLTERRSSKRQWLQFAAAVVAFGVAAALLAALLRGSGAGEPAHGTVPDDGSPTTAVATPTSTSNPGGAVTATAPTSEPATTPASDAVLTFEEAQAAVSFPLIAPRELPEGLTLDSIDISVPERVTAYFSLSGVRQRVAVTQARIDCGPSSMKADTREEIVVNGQSVEHATGTLNVGVPFANYRWQVDDICYDVFAQTSDELSDATVREIVALHIPASEPAEPTQPAEPANPIHPTLALTPLYGDCGDSVIAHGRNFEPGSAISIYSGPMPGDNFGAILENYAVADDGTFAVELNQEMLVWGCGGGTQVREGALFRVTAETSYDMKSGEPEPDVQFATAVFTFMHDIPAAVIENEGLPTCGTEVQRFEDFLGPAIGPDPVLRQCFADAVANGQLAELSVHQPTVEGDYIALLYRSLGNGQVQVIQDSTRDRFAAPGSGFTLMTCSGLTLEPTRYEFQWNACDGGVALE